MIKGFFCQLAYFVISLNATMAWYPAFIVQYQEELHDMANDGFSVSSPSIACKQGPSQYEDRLIYVWGFPC